MPVQVTIVGLGQIGASIGLALAGQKDKITRQGHDRRPEVARQAEKAGAIDKFDYNLPSAVRKADLVILALPAGELRETFEIIAADLKEEAVVLDTAPIKEAVSQWAKELLPPNRHYIGITPAINPVYLLSHENGVEAAHADLFQGGLMAVVVPPGTSSEAVKLAVDLIGLLGASPLFADPVEIDSLLSATHLLPQLLGAAILNATIDQPGWREGRKLAGKPYAQVSAPFVEGEDPRALGSATVLAQESLVRSIDRIIAVLQSYRNDIKEKDNETLSTRLEQARLGRETWWKQRQAGDWAVAELSQGVDMPRPGDFFARLVCLGGRKAKRK